MIRHVKRLLRRVRRDQRGVTFILAAVSMTSLVGFGAVVTDVAYLYHAKRVLQASTDAAALAGAIQLKSSPSTAVATASSYSGASGDKNADPNFTITTNPQSVLCTGSTGATCSANSSNPNGFQVTETATVPLYFARIFGFNTVQISATAFALTAGGHSINTDIMVILDTTASMNSSDASCSGNTRENCAVAGLQTLLSGFSAPAQEVGLMLFPGLDTAADAALEYDCSSSTPSSSAIEAYNASPVYLVVPLSSDYKASGALNTGSNLVIAARGGAAGCTAGLTAIGGVSTFYADVVTAAKTYLSANGRSGANKMIILLSDGDANASTAPTNTQECHQAITASTAAQSCRHDGHNDRLRISRIGQLQHRYQPQHHCLPNAAEYGNGGHGHRLPAGVVLFRHRERLHRRLFGQQFEHDLYASRSRHCRRRRTPDPVELTSAALT